MVVYCGNVVLKQSIKGIYINNDLYIQVVTVVDFIIVQSNYHRRENVVYLCCKFQ